jgi:hypothetical protein
LIANENTRYIIIALECHLVHKMLFTDGAINKETKKTDALRGALDKTVCDKICQ